MKQRTYNYHPFMFCRELGEQEILKKEKASLLANKDETVKTMEMEMQMAKYVLCLFLLLCIV